MYGDPARPRVKGRVCLALDDRPETLKVLKGQDLTPLADKVLLWDPCHDAIRAQGRTTQWQRLCSADLPAESALFGKGRGTRERIFFDGEEVSDPASARAWARIVTGPHAGEAGNCRASGAWPTKTSSPVRIQKTKRW